MADENVKNLRVHLQPFSEAGYLQAYARGEGDWSLLDTDLTYEDNPLPDHEHSLERAARNLTALQRSS